MIIKQANHSLKYRMDLQHFAGDGFDEPAIDPVEDDFILPDDDVIQDDTQPEVETEETQQEETEQEQEKSFKLKVKYNKEDMELDEDRARELAQKGLNYDKLQERVQQLETDPGLAFVKELADENGMTVPQYLEAVRQHREEQRLQELTNQGIPDDVAKEILESRRFREQIYREKKQAEIQAKQAEDIQRFAQMYPEVKPQDIPPTVWQEVNQGRSLVDAYARHENQQLKEQLAVLKKNQENQQKAPIGSLTVHGGDNPASEDPFLKGFDSI